MYGWKRAYLAGLVLCDLVLGVLLAVFALAVGAAGLWNVDLNKHTINHTSFGIFA